MSFFHGGKLDQDGKYKISLTEHPNFAKLHGDNNKGQVWRLLKEYERLVKPHGCEFAIYCRDQEVSEIMKQLGGIKGMFELYKAPGQEH
jgi:hypothetical protein